jgi:D-alanyl-D-alanine carboxypeptidase
MRSGTVLLAFLLISAHCSQAAASGPALLFDPSNGKVLYAEDADNLWYPASLTKLMTAYVTFEAIKNEKLSLKSKVSCSAAAHDEPPSKIGLPIGGELTVDQALQALIVKSANDVAVMLAEAVAGNESDFVARMNATAKRLGMERTTFVNANGLPATDQVTTARDLAKLSRAIITDFPEYDHYWSMPAMRLGKLHLSTHNGLLKSVEGADGLKTGFTCDSGFNIVASATRDGRQLIAVVLGDASSSERNLRASNLLEYGFHQYGWMQLFSDSKTLDSMPYSPTAASVTSMRDSVSSWGCNGKKKARVAKSGKRGKRSAKKSGTKKPAAADKEAQAAVENVQASAANANVNANAPLELRGAVDTPPVRTVAPATAFGQE